MIVNDNSCYYENWLRGLKTKLFKIVDVNLNTFISVLNECTDGAGKPYHSALHTQFFLSDRIFYITTLVADYPYMAEKIAAYELK